MPNVRHSPHPQVGVAAPETPFLSAADCIATILPVWTDLSDTRRMNIASSLRTIARIAGIRPETLMLDCNTINQTIFKPSVVGQGLSDRRRANAKADLRYVLRRLGLHAQARFGAQRLSPEWEELMQALPTKYWHADLIGFIRFCCSRGVAPANVSSADLADYEPFLQHHTLCDDPGSQARATRASWNRASRQVPGWPATSLSRPGMRVPYCLALTDFPVSFQKDEQAFLERLAFNTADAIFPDDIFAVPSGGTAPSVKRRQRRKSAKPRTIATRRFQIRQAASALVRKGIDIGEIRSLRDLVEPILHGRAILEFFYERAGKKCTSQTGALGEILRQIATHHCNLPDEQAAVISGWAANLAPKRDGGMTEKNRHRLRALIQPRTRAMLLHLPQQLMRLAESPDLRRGAAAVFALRAVVCEILLICPMRIENLRQLRIDQHLQRLDPARPLTTHLLISEDEVKNGQHLEWPVPLESAKLIERYLTHYRPSLASPGNNYLFPGKAGEPRSMNAIAGGLAIAASDQLGVELNPHLLRHFAAWSYLKAYPGAYEIVRRVLGHKSIDTTVAFYCGLEAESAAEHFDSAVLKERHATRAVAAKAFRRSPASKGARKSSMPRRTI